MEEKTPVTMRFTYHTTVLNTFRSDIINLLSAFDGKLYKVKSHLIPEITQVTHSILSLACMLSLHDQLQDAQVFRSLNN